MSKEENAPNLLRRSEVLGLLKGWIELIEEGILKDVLYTATLYIGKSADLYTLQGAHEEIVRRMEKNIQSLEKQKEGVERKLELLQQVIKSKDDFQKMARPEGTEENTTEVKDA